jgi:hypothetical protein
MDQQKIKSFLERPEGTTGLLVIGAIICIAGGTIIYFIDAIIKLLQNILYAGFLGASVLAIIAVLLNDNFRWFCKSSFQSGMRKLTGVWITIDPIGILQNYIEDMVEKLKKIERYLSQIGGQITGLNQEISERKGNVATFLKYAAAAEGNGDLDNVQLNSNKAAREKEWVDEMSGTSQQMQDTYDNLKHMKRNLNFLRDDTEHRVGLLKRRYLAITAAYKAMKGARELIEGDRKKAIFEQDCEYIAQDIGNKLGEMDRFFEASHDTFANMDLKNQVLNKDGLALLASWKKDGILNYESNRDKVRVVTGVRVSDHPSASIDEMEAAEQQANLQVQDRPSSFSKIFEKR